MSWLGTSSQLSLFLMPSHNQGLLLETPLEDMLGV